MVDLTSQTQFFKIGTNRSGDVVSIGATGEIRSWNDHNSDEQIWCIYPEQSFDPNKEYTGAAKYRMQTLSNGEFANVSPDGGLLRWSKANDGSQEFTFTQLPNNKVRIGENTKGESVGIDSTGVLVRWASLDTADQKFDLKPVNVIPKKKDEFHPISTFGDPPKTEAFNVKVRKTDPVLISKEYIPAALVADPNYDLMMDQIRSTPYYQLTLEKYWDASGSNDVVQLEGKNTYSHTYTKQTGLSRSSIDQVEKTIGYVVGAKAGVSFGEKAGSEGGDEIMGSAELSFQYQNTKKTLKGTSSDSRETVTDTITKTFDSDGRKRTWVIWHKINKYTLMDNQGNIIQQWLCPTGEVSESSYQE